MQRGNSHKFHFVFTTTLTSPPCTTLPPTFRELIIFPSDFLCTNFTDHGQGYQAHCWSALDSRRIRRYWLRRAAPADSRRFGCGLSSTSSHGGPAPATPQLAVQAGPHPPLTLQRSGSAVLTIAVTGGLADDLLPVPVGGGRGVAAAAGRRRRRRVTQHGYAHTTRVPRRCLHARGAIYQVRIVGECSQRCVCTYFVNVFEWMHSSGGIRVF